MAEKKKKSFWKGRLGIGIIAVVAFMMLTTGAVYAFDFFTGSSEVTVDEAITISVASTPGDGSWSSGVWTVGMYPGETKTTHLEFHNASSADIIVTPTVTPLSYPAGWSGEFECKFASTTYTVPGGGMCPANLQAIAEQGAPTGTYSSGITIAR